jgi:hypothetical protein
MLRYFAAAMALKAFSLNGTTQRLYRKLGNLLAGKSRAKGRIDLESYIRRGNLLVSLFEQYEPLAKDDIVLELGTGWMHWYSIYLRLAHACKIETMDVWDNRQFGAIAANFSRLPNASAAVVEAQSIDELYENLNITHHIIPDGMLTRFKDCSVTAVFSMHVLEHVPRKTIRQVVQDIYRITKPGHHSIHQIGIDDHLAHYAPSVSDKKYISFSDSTYRLLFDNAVQYHNRLQPSDFVNLFEDAGFESIHREQENTDISNLRIADCFRGYSADDLACTILTLVFRKPEN